MREIVGVINGMGDERNLVGVNGGIEGARGGECGGGFWVVGEEV
ncbi:methyl-accepting chemotaxis protein, partial [Bacillus altitudinis]